MYFFFDLLFCVLMLVKVVPLGAAAVVGVVLSGLFSDAFDAIAVHVGSLIAICYCCYWFCDLLRSY